MLDLAYKIEVHGQWQKYNGRS